MTPVNRKLYSNINNGKLDYIYQNLLALWLQRRLTINGKSGPTRSSEEMLRGIAQPLIKGSWSYEVIMNIFLEDALLGRIK